MLRILVVAALLLVAFGMWFSSAFVTMPRAGLLMVGGLIPFFISLVMSTDGGNGDD